MKVDNLRIYCYVSEFKQPIRTVKIELKERKVLVISVDIDGQRYYAESNAFETTWYHFETIDSVSERVKVIFEELRTIDINSYEALGQWLYQFKDTPHAIALFDFIGYQYFHELPPVTVPLGYTLHGDMKEVKNRVKLKWYDGILEQVQQIRVHDTDIKIAIDANGSLSEIDLPAMHALMKYHVDYFEEPFSELNLYKKHCGLPLAIDESADSIDSILKYKSIGVETIIAKYARLGGRYPLLKLHEAIPDMNIIIGGMYEFGLSKYYTATLSQHFGTIPDMTPKGFYFYDDYCDYNETIEAGMLTMDFPKVNEEKLELVYPYVS